MSDKSFGDHISRQSVKNPLLSTAVTGLSIEDLSHNAVLLPAAPTQVLFARQEPSPAAPAAAAAAQIPTLGIPEHSGVDLHTVNRITTHEDNTNNGNVQRRNAPTVVTQKKKSSDQDDFDVNEYFARLQGTRYVSAPHNLHVEDQNANLAAAEEESLEEINLNEPERQEDSSAQSLTADIAQNFSQLPTVLPQMASAVFSSFSSMLAYRGQSVSREGTTAEVKQSMPTQQQRPEEMVTTSLKAVDGMKPAERPPPLTEPPITGPGNYRITTRKKAYAQIPGLSSANAAAPPSSIFTPQTAPTQEHTQQYFTPTDLYDHNTSNPQDFSLKQADNVKDVDTFVDVTKSKSESTNAYTFTPISNEHKVTEAETKAATVDMYASAQVFEPPAFSSTIQPPSASIIPPPPMFSNVQRKDSQPAVKSVLPPSVARRISANHPLMKPQSTVPVFSDNIFVPASIEAPNPVEAAKDLIQPQMFAPMSSIENVSAKQTSAVPTLGPNIPPNPSFYAPPTKESTSSIFDIQSASSIPMVEQKAIAAPSDFYQTVPPVSVPLAAPPTFFNPGNIKADSDKSIEQQPPVLPPTSNLYHATPSATAPPAAPLTFFNPGNIKLEDNKPLESQILTPASTLYQATPPAPLSLGPPPTFFNPANIKPEDSKTLEQGTSVLPPTSSVYMTTPSAPTPLAPPPTFFNPGNVKPQDTKQVQLQASVLPPTSNLYQATSSAATPLAPPPTFFNPANIKAEEAKPSPDTVDRFATKAHTEAKPLVEPPKATGVSYRMAKKRPQYYSGPIVGIGDISNNIKPVIDPIDPVGFQGTLFTPNQSSATINQPVSDAFDISKPIDTYQPIDLNNQLEFDTAFDVSRDAADKYEPKHEARGFGLIGSLKSKLSSLDINKIQNTVTTFFDPAYNAPKSVPVENDPSVSGNKQYQGGLDGIFEVNVGGQQQHSQGYGYGYQQQAYSDSYNQLYDNQNTSFYSNQPNYGDPTANTNVYGYVAPELGQSAPSSETTANVSQSFEAYTVPTNNQLQYSENKVYPNTEAPNSAAQPELTTTPSSVFYQQPLVENVATATPSSIFYSQTVDNTPGLVDTTATTAPSGIFYQQPVKPGEPVSVEKVATFDISTTVSAAAEPENKMNAEIDILKAVTNPVDFFNVAQIAHAQTEQDGESERKNSEIQSKTEENAVEEVDVEIEPPTSTFYDTRVQPIQEALGDPMSFFDIGNTSEVPLQTSDIFSFNPPESTTLTKKDPLYRSFYGVEDTKPGILTTSISNLSLNATSPNTLQELKDIDEEIKQLAIDESKAYERKESDEYVDEVVEKVTGLILADDDDENVVSDLNICETCREVNKPEDCDEAAVDLTTQMIENITSPIQLLNPVVVPLPDDVKPVAPEEAFDEDQCAEITHITEETREIIQVQSATELLDDEAVINNSIHAMTYGWNATDNFYPTQSLEHEGAFQANPNAIAFFNNASLFFNNVPTNASDEIKAELKNSHEEPITLAPPAPLDDFDDTKSDETGVLDVHSIEQDARNDFPVEEEYVIEPSETDDDKIEFRERERSSEDPVQDVDTFTNRVERFKKLGETFDEDVFDVSGKVQSFDMQASPAITIASYFDTGNYAVESHYRNSLSSPPTLGGFTVASPTAPVRIPPGFEEQYTRKLSDAGVVDDDEPKASSVEVTPDSDADIKQSVVKLDDTKHKEEEEEKEEDSRELEKEILPPFASIFGKKAEETKATEAATSSIQSLFPNMKPIEHKPQLNLQSLPDPMNFFSADVDDVVQEPNRLASYFTSPPKTEQSKSFFDLSQGQDHYRLNAPMQTTSQVYNKAAFDSRKSKPIDHQTFFKLSQDTVNIPEEKYMANLNLMKDLASYNPDESPKHDIVRTVNYFTVEYDNDLLNKVYREHVKSDADVIEDTDADADADTDAEAETETESDTVDDAKFASIVNSCEHCFNNSFVVNNVEIPNAGFVSKIRRATNCEESGGASEKDANMEQRSERVRQTTISLNSFESDNTEREENGVDTLNENRATTEYSPVRHHWFYRVDLEGKSVWRGFCASDSKALEEAFLNPNLTEETLVPTDGGRYDVNVVGRLRYAVYWSEKPTNVWRCSWFYKGTTDARYVPYTEQIAEKLEEEYRHGLRTGEWHRRLVLANNEMVVMHGPQVMVHFPQGVSTDFTSTPQSTTRPRVVRRGCDESEIEDAVPSHIEHLLLLCHGVGSACDMRFRSVEEVVDDFRLTSLQLTQSHYKNSYENGRVGRMEVLPISWHSSLHSGEAGVDRRLARLTLDSIPRLRNFTNDTVLDVLFYTSPVYCQTIVDTVCSELNRVYNLFVSRNPGFRGGVSLGGHSLGSVILYDLLCHQVPKSVPPGAGSPGSPGVPAPPASPSKRYVSGGAGAGQPPVRYPRLHFEPDALYALGSPIAIFECIRGVESLGPRFALPTCRRFFNIFHPYDPIAYRIEPLINPELQHVKPSLIPHHKGRKRMHLELKETMLRVGADLKQKLVESLRSTWTSMWRQPPHALEKLQVVEEELEKEQLTEEKEEIQQPDMDASVDGGRPAVGMGCLNDGRRIDYVLQEAPFEMINEYLFAMTSHVCYWESEDTMLLILREVYDALGVRPDCSVPQHNLTVQRSRKEESVLIGSDHPSTSGTRT